MANPIPEGLLPDETTLKKLLDGRLADPHSVLGMHGHEGSGGMLVRVYDPMAKAVWLLADDQRVPLERVAEPGLFAVALPDRKGHFAYRLEKEFEGGSFISEDPYSFLPGIGEMDMYLFNEGEHRRIYEVLGAHRKSMGNVDGVLFAVWAPNADRVSVVGSFNCWDGRRHQMRLMGSSGIWELFVPRLREGELYKYEIRARSGMVYTKLDPYAQRTEMRPHTAAIVPSGKPFEWSDKPWLEKRAKTRVIDSPMSVYEVHLGSWRHPSMRPVDPKNEDDFHSYRELAKALGDYAVEMGYTHIELLPVCEHPLDQSWGYQVTGFYAPTARYGTPEDFAYFVDHLHSLGIGVILDWVPAHFPKDDFSLGRFDGTALYEHADPRQGEHRDWGTYIFNFGRTEVRNFLIGSALYWLDKFHIDGLRVDAVASMLYLDYSREDGDWIPNKYGGNENLDAISFIKRLNELAHELFPGIAMIAEESTAWPSVSRPVYVGGLGFTFKWNMGWMHDTLEYYSLDPIYRSYNHGKLTFSLLYAFSENFILPLSHDEVVHGKCSLLNKMPGDYQQKFANLRALYGFMTTHPGKKLLFMGSEFAQWIEWNSNAGLDWLLLDYPIHEGMRTLCKDLNLFYVNNPALYEDDFSPSGFQWIDGGDYQQSVISYVRWDKKRQTPVLAIINLTPVVRDNFLVGVPLPGKWVEVFNTDNTRYGGTGLLNEGVKESIPGKHHGQSQCVSLRLPWLSAVFLKPAL